MSDARPNGLRRRLRTALASRLGSMFVSVLGRTWRYTLIDRDGVDRMRAAGRPIIFAIWHGELLPFLWLHRDERVAVLISTHSDGEVIARIAESLGYRTVRGSSTRGGVRAFRDLIQVLDDGGDVAVTPDGPRGPRHRFAPGALAASQRTGSPVICGRARASRGWRLRSWDRFLIPKPFARITVAYSEGEALNERPAEAIEGDVARFEATMARLGEPNDEP